MKIKILIIFYILFIFLSALSAESLEFTQKYNARAIGMANTFCAIADDSTAVFYNPAGLGQVNGKIFNSMYADIHNLGIIRNYIFSGAGRYNDSMSMGAGWVFEQVDLDPEVWNQHRFFYGISLALLEKAYIGITPKLIFINTDLENYNKIWGFGIDGGLLVSSENWEFGFLDNNNMILQLGITVKNIYSEIKWHDTYKEEETFNLIWWGINLNYNQFLNLSVQIKSDKTYLHSFASGLEFLIFNGFGIQLDEKYKVDEISIRCGLEINKYIITQNTYSFGIGIKADNYSFDYAVAYQADYFSLTHYFSLNAIKY